MGERYRLKVTELGEGAVDLQGAKAISTVDWSTRSLWGMHYHEPTQSLWLHADAGNDEVMNLWRLPMKEGAKGEPEAITHADYVYGYGFSEDESKVRILGSNGHESPIHHLPAGDRRPAASGGGSRAGDRLRLRRSPFHLGTSSVLSRWRGDLLQRPARRRSPPGAAGQSEAVAGREKGQRESEDRVGQRPRALAYPSRDRGWLAG